MENTKKTLILVGNILILTQIILFIVLCISLDYIPSVYFLILIGFQAFFISFCDIYGQNNKGI